MSKAPKASPEQKARAIQLLYAGHAVSYVAKEVGVCQSTISKWKKAGLDAFKEATPLLTDEERAEFRATIERNLFLTIIEGQEVLRAQMKVMKDEKWIKQQSGQDLAIIHGIIHDKVVRILEAAEGPPEEGNQP